MEPVSAKDGGRGERIPPETSADSGGLVRAPENRAGRARRARMPARSSARRVLRAEEALVGMG
jgi:hypothetical protein